MANDNLGKKEEKVIEQPEEEDLLAQLEELNVKNNSTDLMDREELAEKIVLTRVVLTIRTRKIVRCWSWSQKLVRKRRKRRKK